jgi:mannose-6-phosphate isomerase-like protein (cupin superfamily)
VTATTQRSPLIRQIDTHPRMETWGVRVKILVSATESGGKLSIIEYVAPPTGLGPPLHIHREMDENFHIVTGEMNFQINDQQLIAKPGTMLHVPAGTPHAFWNTSNEPTTMLVTMAPGGFENYLIELFQLAAKHPAPTNDVRPLIAQLGEKYDQVVVGPPPGTAKAKP